MRKTWKACGKKWKSAWTHYFFCRQLVSYIFENKRLLILMSRFVHCLTQTATRLLRQVCKDTGVSYNYVLYTQLISSPVSRSHQNGKVTGSYRTKNNWHFECMRFCTSSNQKLSLRSVGQVNMVMRSECLSLLQGIGCRPFHAIKQVTVCQYFIYPI